jgi:hypothetical protein
VSPSSGSTGGGTAITVTGSGFVAGDRVVIGQGNGSGAGAIAASEVSVVSSTEITATTGGGAAPGTGCPYTVASGDAGHTIEAVVTAHNPARSTAANAPIVPLIDNFDGSSVDTNVWDVLNQQGDTSNSETECHVTRQVAEGFEYADRDGGREQPPRTPDERAVSVRDAGLDCDLLGYGGRCRRRRPRSPTAPWS